MKYKKGDKVRVRADLEVNKKYGGMALLAGSMETCRGEVGTVMSNSDEDPYVVFPHLANGFYFSNEMLEPVQTDKETFFKIGDIVQHLEYGTGRILSMSCTSYATYNSFADRITYDVEFWFGIEAVEHNTLKKLDSEKYKSIPIFTINKNKPCQVSFDSEIMNIDLTFNQDKAEEMAKRIKEILENDKVIRFKNGSSIEVIKKENDEMKLKFHTKEGYRIDKTNNGRIPTITTYVTVINKVGIFRGEATCDKMEYDEREGVLNACANALLGSFDREYNNEVKRQAKRDLHNRTCKTCHQVFDTPEEARAHEKWHIENKKARRQRYLERKEARDRLAEMEREGRIEQYMKELAK